MLDLMRPFSEFAEELSGALWGTVNVSYWDVLAEPTYEEARKSILETPQKRGDRTDEDIEIDVVRGKAIEIGIAKMLPGTKIWDAPWKKEDPHSYGKDLITHDGIRIETKHTSIERCFWTSKHSHKVLTRCINHGTMDAIVVAKADYDASFDGFVIKPHLLIEPTSYKFITDDEGNYYSYRTLYGVEKRRCKYINFKDE